MKKILTILLTAIIFISSFCVTNASAAYDDVMEEMKLYSDCLLLVSTDNGEIIFSKNANKQTAPASLTKIITAIVVLENCSDLTATVTIPESCIRELDGTGSSLGGLMVGEQLTVYDLLCCLMLVSANESATTLADYVSGGDRAKFVSMMNEVAERLGCTNSHFENPHGLDNDNQYVTATDMAKFITHAMSFPAFEEIVAKKSYVLPETNMQQSRTIHTSNYMLISRYKDYYCKYVKGGKTGSTSNAGRCFVAYAAKDGYNYVAVALNSIFSDVDNDGVNENGSFLDCKEMLDWTFSNIELAAVADTTRVVGQIPVKYAKSVDYITLSPSETVYSLVPKGTDSGSLLVELIDAPESVRAPVKKGDIICRGRVMYAGDVIKEIDLVSNIDAKISIFAFLGSTAKSVLSSWVFRIAAIIIVIVLIILISRKRKKNNSRPVSGKSYRVLNYNDFMKMR